MELLKKTISKSDLKENIYVDGLYYLTAINPARILISEDLEEWNEIDVSTYYAKDSALSIAYGNNIFVCCGGANFVMTSKDGINWIKINVPCYSNYGKKNINAAYNSVSYINNKFIIVTGTVWSRNGVPYKEEGHILVSRDGINWNNVAELDESLMDISYNSSKYVVIGTNGYIATSNNLSSWTKRKSNITKKLVGIIFGKGQFIITGAAGTILTSVNGIDWVLQKSGTTSYLIRARYGNGLYVACGYNGTLLVSTDALTWNTLETGTNVMFYGLLYYDNKYIFLGEEGYLGITNTTRDISSSDEECLYIFNNKLELLGIIESFTSLRWRRKFFEAGTFEMVLVPDDNNLRLLKKDNIIIRSNYTEAGIIETIGINDNGKDVEINCSGRFLSSILDRRIIKNTINYSGSIIDGMKKLLDDMTPFPAFEVETTTISTENIQFQCTYKNVYSYLVSLSKASNIGFRIVPNIENKVYIFENYVGVDRSNRQSINERYSFCEDMGNIEKAEYLYTSKTEYNYALVGGQGEGTSRVLVETKKGNNTGFELKEVFIDAKNQTKQNLSDIDYKNILKELGKQSLTDCSETFEASVYATDYKTKWDLGDIVNVQKEKWGIEQILRITEVEEVIENGKKTVTPVFGDPLPEFFDFNS